MSRRRLMGLAGLGAAAALADGCASSVSRGLTAVQAAGNRLTYWNLFGGGDGGRMVAMEHGYEKDYPNIDLIAVTLAWGNPYYTKLALATLGRKPPNVAISHLSRAGTLAKADLLEPLDLGDLAKHGMTPDKFTKVAWDNAHFGGKLYAIPLDTHPFVLFYNLDVCKKAGLLDSDGTLKPIRSPEEMTSAFQAAAKVTGKYGASIATVGDTATGWRVFWSLYAQLQGEVLADDGAKVVLDDDKAIKVLSFLRSLTIEKKLMPIVDYGGAISLFATNKVGFFMQGEWEVTTFETAKTHFSMTSFPHIYGPKPAVQADSHTFVLPRDAARTPQMLDRELTFIRNLLGQSMTWAKGGHIPAWLPVQNSAAYKNLKPQSNYADSAQFAKYDPPAWYSGSGSNFEIDVGSAVLAVEAGQMSPAQAVKQVRARLTKLAQSPSPLAS